MVLSQPISQLRMENAAFVSIITGNVVVRGVSLSAVSGDRWAIMGASGSGKSSLSRMLLGIWPLAQGSLRFNDIEVRSLDTDKIGHDIGYLPQDIELLAGSIGQNIARFEPTIDMDKVAEAAMLAGVNRWIERLPEGYDTAVGFEEGHVLSGGQRQQIALARAYYGRPSLLILDEPNANLDEVGERLLNQALSIFKSWGAIVFVVTHRPSVIDAVDHVLVLKNGMPVFIGNVEQYKAHKAS